MGNGGCSTRKDVCLWLIGGARNTVGKKKEVEMKYVDLEDEVENVMCTECQGKGYVDTCEKCAGTGRDEGVQCGVCDGAGHILCSECRGSGYN